VGGAGDRKGKARRDPFRPWGSQTALNVALELHDRGVLGRADHRCSSSPQLHARLLRADHPTHGLEHERSVTRAAPRHEGTGSRGGGTAVAPGGGSTQRMVLILLCSL
jgi:hypothetical protein